MFSLDFVARPGWLHVTGSGELNESTDRAIDERVAAECLRRGLRAALIDIRDMHGRLGIVQNFEAAADFGVRVGDALDRVAIVDLPEFTERSDLFENTAVNRGANVRFYTRIADAEAWLTEQ